MTAIHSGINASGFNAPGLSAIVLLLSLAACPTASPAAEKPWPSKNLKPAMTHEDAVVGTLTLDTRIDAYSSAATWGGRPVQFIAMTRDDAELEKALATARALWREQPRWRQRIDDYAVQELLPLKNDVWLGEDEKPFDAASFKARMQLETIAVYPDGRFEFWHEDGDLFWGHAIQVRGSLADGPTSADIPG